jgi:hypothetical protein
VKGKNIRSVNQTNTARN